MGTASASWAPPDTRLLEAAREGDQDAFRQLLAPHHGDLHAHCYRMLGSVHDAEDALQDALLRAWRGLRQIADGRALRAWLYRIATNACLDAIARRQKRMLPIEHGPLVTAGEPAPEDPLPESVWIEPYPDAEIGISEGYASPEARYEQREAIELAFIAALQHLPGRQRAVLILREVLGFSAKEVAEALDSTPASVNSALQRARKTVDERLPEKSQQATMRAIGDDRVRAIVQRFTDAFESGEVDAILKILAEDATFAMPPYAGWYQGRDAIGDSWLMPGAPPPHLRYVPTRANGQLALGTYALDRDRGVYEPVALDVLTMRGEEVVDVLAFRAPHIFRSFGLPDHLPYAAS